MTTHSPEATIVDVPPPTHGAGAASLSLPPATDDAFPLAIRGVTKRWRGGQTPVLDGVELALQPRTITWVGGRNGAGKTTMLRIAAGLIEPDCGRAEVWGVTSRENRSRYQTLLSFLPAGDRGLYARLSVRRQLDFWARISMVPAARATDAVDAAIEAFDLVELAERRVDRMSMGQRQRLRVAMTFLADPKVVLLDEPLTSLDSEGIELLLGAIRRLLARNGAVLWCSPEDERVEMPFDARWLIDHGRLVPP